ncbi:uncharacterized protein ACNLHF_024544 isoform 2-T3 [Anomaloglossus baeobatrachus]
MDIFRPQLLSQDRRGPSPTSKMSQPSEKIDYLDVRVFKGSDGLLCTDIFRKDPAVNSILSAKSSHPKQTVDMSPATNARFVSFIRDLCIRS